MPDFCKLILMRMMELDHLLCFQKRKGPQDKSSPGIRQYAKSPLRWCRRQLTQVPIPTKCSWTTAVKSRTLKRAAKLPVRAWRLTSKGNFVFFDSSPGFRMERHCFVSESQPYAPAIRARTTVILAAGKVIQLHLCPRRVFLTTGGP